MLFDFDGTLVDSAPSTTRALNSMITSRGGAPLNDGIVRPLISLGGEAMIRRALGEYARETADDLSELRDLLAEWPPGDDEIFPGVISTLRRFREVGIKLAICTNKRQNLTDAIVTQTSLAPFFDAVVGATPLRRLKPASELVHITLEKLGVASHEAVLVGDSEVDAAAASTAGLPFLLVEYGYPVGQVHSIPCAARVRCFADLIEVIENMIHNVDLSLGRN
jgi:phosphoglycolate phosphatase